INDFFGSNNLLYSSKPMETKLRELHGIFYRLDLTREIQEKLFQLGYEIHIDGRYGSGTKRAITAFQKDNGHPQTGQSTDSTLALVNKALKTNKKRPLSSYKPPVAQKPSRTVTYGQFTSPDALAKIKNYYKQDLKTFQRMTKKYGVPGELVASIMWIETRYGEYFGVNRAASMLASMALASADFRVVEPAVSDLANDKESRLWLKETAAKRGDWALNELAALMTYSHKNGLDPNSFPGSIYGAVGYGQFMPSNLLKFSADGTGNGKADPFNREDAIFSIGNYIQAHGWKNGQSEEARRSVIMKYNKSGIYTNTVLYVADWLAKQ
ncbi:MAG: lytic murein transglycosylase, partial [Candidatus Adiutrix sp.]